MACSHKLSRSFPSAVKTGVVSSRTYPQLLSYRKMEGSAMVPHGHVAKIVSVQHHQSPMPMFQEPASVVNIDRLAIEGMSAYTGWPASDGTSLSDGSSCQSPPLKPEPAKGGKEHSKTAADRLDEFSEIEEISDNGENNEYFAIDPYSYEPHHAPKPHLVPPSAVALPTANPKQYKHTFHYPPIGPVVDCHPSIGVSPAQEQTKNSDSHTIYLRLARAKLSLTRDGNPIASGVQPESKVDVALDASRNLSRQAKSWIDARNCHQPRRDERQPIESRLQLIPEE